MSFSFARNLVAVLLLALASGAVPTQAQTAATGIQRTNHFKFLGAWWTKNDATQPEANKIDIRSPSDRQFNLIIKRPNWNINSVVCGPLAIGSKYRSEPVLVKIPNTTWQKRVYLQVENRGGKFFLEALDQGTFAVSNTTGIGAPFPPTFSFELVRRK